MLKLSIEELSALDIVLNTMSVKELLDNAVVSLKSSELPEDLQKVDICKAVLNSLR
jgi:hypothetical protein